MSPAAAPSTELAIANTQELTEMFHGTDLQRPWELARFYASTSLVGTKLRGKPAEVMAILIASIGDGFGTSPTDIKRYWIGPDGTPERTAQSVIDIAARNGVDTDWGTITDEVAELRVRRPGSARWQVFRYTVDDARRAHDLDQWVERWQDAQSGKRYSQKFIFECNSPDPCPESLGPMPDWARKELDAGNIKRSVSYYNRLSDMLCARVATRAVKRGAPGVLGMVSDLGYTASVSVPAPGDDDIADAELVEPGGEPFEDLEPEVQAGQQPEVQPEMVAGEKAKWELVEAAMAEGLVELQARTVAAQVWRSYRFNELGGAIPRQSLDIVLEEVRQEAKKASAAAAQPSGEAGTNPAVAAEEDPTLFGGES